jgi:hypothetical protein
MPVRTGKSRSLCVDTMAMKSGRIEVRIRMVIQGSLASN